MWRAREVSYVSDIHRSKSIHGKLTTGSGSTQHWEAAVHFSVVFKRQNRRPITVLVERIPKHHFPRKVCVFYVRSSGLSTDMNSAGLHIIQISNHELHTKI
jgi:hypothetical protein